MCVLVGSAFCTLFCFGLVCVCVCVFCFASFVLIWSVCVCVLAGSAFCTSFCFVWCRLVRRCPGWAGTHWDNLDVDGYPWAMPWLARVSM